MNAFTLHRALSYVGRKWISLHKHPYMEKQRQRKKKVKPPKGPATEEPCEIQCLCHWLMHICSQRIIHGAVWKADIHAVLSRKQISQNTCEIITNMSFRRPKIERQIYTIPAKHKMNLHINKSQWKHWQQIRFFFPREPFNIINELLLEWYGGTRVIYFHRLLTGWEEALSYKGIKIKCATWLMSRLRSSDRQFCQFNKQSQSISLCSCCFSLSIISFLSFSIFHFSTFNFFTSLEKHMLLQQDATDPCIQPYTFSSLSLLYGEC